ncbi:MAG TPA: hypothetical protein VF516_10155 [Kofleriaceae bacterium]
MDVEISLYSIHCFNSGERGHAEPYLWTTFFKIDDSVVKQRTDDPRFVSGTPEIVFGQGSHGNLGAPMATSDTRAIDTTVGRYLTSLGNLTIKNPLDGTTILLPGIVGAVVLLMEENSVSDDGAVAAHRACNALLAEKIPAIVRGIDMVQLYLTAVQLQSSKNLTLIEALTQALSQLVQAQVPGLVEAAKQRIKDAVKAAQNVFQDISAAADSDDVIDFQILYHASTELVAPSFDVEFSLKFQEAGQTSVSGGGGVTPNLGLKSYRIDGRFKRAAGTDRSLALGGTLTSGPCVCSRGENRLDVFARGADHSLVHKLWNGSKWSDWEGLGGQLTSDPAAVSWASDRIDVFARGLDNSLYHLYWNGKWSNWQGLGGQLTSSPAVCSWAKDRLDVFALGTDGSLYHKYWNGSKWSGWEGLGGQLSSDPAAVSWGSDRIDVFARGMDNALYHKYWNGSKWSGWEGLGGQLSSGPAAASRGAHRLDVFGRGTDGSLYHRLWDGSAWSSWEGRGGVLTSDPDAVAWSSQRLDIFFRGSDQGLHQIWWNSGIWHP